MVTAYHGDFSFEIHDELNIITQLSNSSAFYANNVLKENSFH